MSGLIESRNDDGCDVLLKFGAGLLVASLQGCFGCKEEVGCPELQRDFTVRFLVSILQPHTFAKRVTVMIEKAVLGVAEEDVPLLAVRFERVLGPGSAVVPHIEPPIDDGLKGFVPEAIYDFRCLILPCELARRKHQLILARVQFDSSGLSSGCGEAYEKANQRRPPALYQRCVLSSEMPSSRPTLRMATHDYPLGLADARCSASNIFNLKGDRATSFAESWGFYGVLLSVICIHVSMRCHAFVASRNAARLQHLG